MNSLRPYQPLVGMSTVKWMTIEARLIDVNLLVPCQHHVSPGWQPGMSYTKDRPVYVVYYEGKYYVEDGHNRLNHAKQQGQKLILARVLYKVNDQILVPIAA